MSSDFYASIITEEKAKFNVTNSDLKFAAKSISINYNKTSLREGTTYLDYSEPENRCAYLYKYAALHTGLTTKYMRKLVQKKQVKRILYKKRKLKICFFGGGPGTDVVGLFKALAVMQCFEKRIAQVTILDICKGWDETFQLIMERLIAGEVTCVPDTFVNKEHLKWNLKEVDLLKDLPTDVKESIRNADIVCMVKFVSAILAKENSLNALKALWSLIKPEGVVLFIDNYQGNIFVPVEDVSKCVGFESVMGPLHETYVKTSKSSLGVYGCSPQIAAKVSVIGWIKSGKICANMNYTTEKCSSNSILDNEECNWETESESRPSSITSFDCLEDCSTQNKIVQSACDKNTQTDDSITTHKTEELSELLLALSDLVTVLEKIRNL